MRSSRRRLGVSVVAGLTVLAAPGAAAAGDLVQLGFQLVNVHSGRCLTVTAGGLADGAILIQQACTRAPAARWRFVRAGAGTYRIVNVNSGKCLAVAGNSVDDNGFVVQAGCGDDPSRQWRLRGAVLPVPGGEALLENGRSRRCLTIAGGSDAENGVAVQYACGAETARRWSMRLVAGPALAGPALAGPALEGPALEGPALEGPALEGRYRPRA